MRWIDLALNDIPDAHRWNFLNFPNRNVTNDTAHSVWIRTQLPGWNVVRILSSVYSPLQQSRL